MLDGRCQRYLSTRRSAIPCYSEFVDELPFTKNGKEKKYVSREQGVSLVTWDRKESKITVVLREKCLKIECQFLSVLSKSITLFVIYRY